MLCLKTLGRISILSLLLITPTFATEKSNATQLAELAKSNSPALRDAITATFDAKDLKEGTAWLAVGPDFFFTIDALSQPTLVIDGNSEVASTFPPSALFPISNPEFPPAHFRQSSSTPARFTTA